MSRARRLGFRARFMIVSAAFVVTTAAAAVWTLLVLTRLAAVTSTMARDSEDTTGATSALTGAIEREDDALLVVLGGTGADRAPLDRARARTDAAQRRLRALLADTVESRLADDIDASVAAYRSAGDRLRSEALPGGLDGYHLRVNPRLRLVVAAVARVRDRHFAEARSAAALARTEVAKTRRVVAAIAAVSLLFALAVALRMSQLVIAPLRELAGAARRIQEGHFETRIDVPPGDEVAQLAAAFNEMASRLDEFRRSNITEVLRAKSALDAMMSALPDALLLVDAAGGVVSSNPAAETLFLRAGQAAPRTVDELVAFGLQRGRILDALGGATSSEAVGLSGASTVRVGDQLRQLSARMIPAARREEERSGIIVVLSDVTELARLDEMRAELIAVASHELRTPVTTLRMSLLMLREEGATFSARARELIDTAIGGVEQLGATVDELLDVTRIEAGRLGLQLELVDLGALVREAADRALPHAEELGVRMSVETRVTRRVRADRGRLRIVFDNLLNNALKYTPAGGEVGVSLSTSPAMDRVTLEVTDTGPGIPEEFRQRVFEKFFRVEHHHLAREESPRGTGIGLYLCKEIIEMHGGRIHCEPGCGAVGTRVALWLPLAAAEA